MIFAFEIVLLIIFGFFLLYLAVLSILALTARKRKVTKTSRFRKMAVIVPAHNEEVTIGRTLHSLLAVNYPRDSYDLIVIADNCTDRTADRARASGAIVYERENVALQGKGHALRWCFDLLLSGNLKYEALVVVDADSVVSNNFLEVMNFYLEKGGKAIQCSDVVELQPGSWSSEATRLGFVLYNYVRPLGRQVIRCSAVYEEMGCALRLTPYGKFRGRPTR